MSLPSSTSSGSSGMSDSGGSSGSDGSSREHRTALETVTLEDPAGSGALVRIAPERGGIVTRFFVGERPILFLDESTLVDPSKNVRGGNPVLFPSPGPLTGGQFSWRGVGGAMKQHGFARQKPWNVTAQSGTSVTLELISDDATRAEFPWDFTATYRYELIGTRLHIEQRIANRSTKEMPFASGFHPYFAVSQADKGAARIPTNATRAWDNVAKREIDVAGPIDLTASEVDLHLVDHGRSEASLTLADGSRIAISASPEFSRWVIWTLAGKDFVCLEPWTGAADALNTGRGIIIVPSGAEYALWTEIAFVAPAAATT